MMTPGEIAGMIIAGIIIVICAAIITFFCLYQKMHLDRLTSENVNENY